MKTALFKRIILAVAIQMLLASSVCGQKYENGTRLLKGAEVLSATPLQLDYVLEKLADTAKITVNIHEGKTHLVLNDGSGVWREWWYYMGRWQVKTKDGALPIGKDGSIQTKSGKTFAGSTLGINEGFIRSLDDTPGDVGMNNKNATIRVTPQSMAVMEATKTGTKGNITSNVYVAGNETEQNVTWISQDPKRGSRLRMDTTILEHAQTSTVFDFWNFKSSLPDTTFYVKKRLKFDQPKTTVYAKGGDLRLSDKTGDFALADLINVAESDPTIPSHVKSITTTNVSNWNTAYANNHTHANKAVLDGITTTNVTNWTNAFGWGNHATQGYLKTETDPVWTAEKTGYYTKANLQTSGAAQVHWDNLTNKPALATGSVTSVGMSLPAIFMVTGSPVTTAGTLAATLVSQTKNTVLAAPVAANGVPAFRTLQESDIPDLAWTKITGKPDMYTKTETRAVIGDTAKVLRNLIKNNVVTESDPTVPAHVKAITATNVTNWNTAYTNSHTHGNKTVLDGITSANVTNWTNAFNWGNHATQGYLKAETDPVWMAASVNYYTKSNLQTSGGAAVHWDNISNKPAMGTGSVTSVGMSLPSIFTVTGTPVTASGTLSATLTSQTKNMVLAAPVAANGVPTFRTLQDADLPDIAWTKVTSKPTTVSGYGITDTYTKTNLQTSGGATVHWDNVTNKPAMGTGSVTSVGLSLPATIFTVTGSPVTSSGTLTATLGTQFKNYVFAAPVAANGVPTFRTLQLSDLPEITWTSITGKPTTVSGYGITDVYTKSNMQISNGGAQLHWDNITSKPSSFYTLPAATATTLGGIKVGSGLSVTADGTLSASSNVMVIQDIGTSTTSVFSQKGVTDLLFYNNDKTKVRIGYGNQATPASGIYSTQVGGYSSASGNRATTIGFSSTSSGYGSVAVGAQNEASADASVALGIGATATAVDGIAIGQVTEARGFRTVALGYGSIATEEYTVSVGNNNPTVNNNKRIVNMSAGINPNDAVNMAQLDLRGKIYVQSTEPTIPTNSFAFWVNGTTFYLILRSGTTQKKVQLQ